MALGRRWLASILVCALCGCSTVSNSKLEWRWPWSKPGVVESAYEAPTRIAVIWTPDVLVVPGHPAARGFGGRIYFYNGSNEPVPVDGQLIVYGFDDTNPDEASTVPEKRFAFTPEQFTKHFGATEIGASYSIWIPWDHGQDQRTVSLVPVFTSVQGHRLVGEPTVNVLRGATANTLLRKDEWLRDQQRRAGVVPAGYEQFLSPSTQSTQSADERASGSSDRDRSEPTGTRIQTMTIPLTPNLGRQLDEVRAGVIDRNGTPSAPSVSGGSLSDIDRKLETMAALQRMNAGVSAREAAGAPTAMADTPNGRDRGSPASHAFNGAPPPAPPVARFEPHRFPVPARPIAPVRRDHGPWARHPAEQQSPHPYSRTGP